MNKDREVLRLFKEVCDLPDDEMIGRLAELCAGDEDLRSEVQTLLDSESDLGDATLDWGLKTRFDRARETVAADLGAKRGPRRIGGYEIIDELGRGGMGVVYRARQETPSRIVALKVLSPTLADGQGIRRFELETSVLARLQHPGIATIFEVGTTTLAGSHIPFFAMELIEGDTLIRHADKVDADVRRRIEWLRDIAHAVHHAHLAGFIHRDLKPANILVGPSGSPKVLDFGVARAVDRDVQSTLQTRTGEVVGTLAYMSPEQVSGDPAAIDIRLDVYALGVVGYELLVGELPFDFSSCSLPEAARRICDDTVTPPSKTRRHLRGDLETIVLKAIEKKKERRYPSARDLADDLDRFLNHEPIHARPPSATYRVGKFVRRYRTLVIATLLLFVAVTAGLVATVVQSGRATRQAQIASEANRFLREIFSKSTPRHGVVGVRDLLDRAAARLDREHLSDPLVRIEVLTTIAEAYLELHEPERARPLLEEAVRLRRATGEGHSLWHLLNLVGTMHIFAMEHAEAVGALDEALAEKRRLGLGGEDGIRASRAGALVNLGRAEEAVSELERIIDKERSAGQIHPGHLNSLARAHLDLREYDQAEALSRQAAEAADSLDMIYVSGFAWHVLGTVLFDQGRHGEAVPCYEKALARKIDAYGEDNEAVYGTQVGFAIVLFNLREYARAEALFRDAVRGRRALAEPNQLPDTLMKLGRCLRSQRKFDEAITVFEETLELTDRVADEALYMRTVYELALSLRNSGQAEQSIPHWQSYLEWRRTTDLEGAEVVGLDGVITSLSVSLLRTARPQEARPLLEESLRLRRAEFGEESMKYGSTAGLLGEALLESGDHDQAEQWIVREGYERLSRHLPVGSGRLKEARELVVRYYETIGNHEKAAAYRVASPPK